jgi:NADH:ubiquinone oxidoreductase subunit F (NADH-binding)
VPSIIHELTLLQEREGWLSEESLRSLAERLNVPLHRIESVSTFYTHFRRTPPKPLTVHVCRDLSCMLAGSEHARKAIEEAFAGRDDVEIRDVSCLGRCEAAPVCDLRHRTVPLGAGENAPDEDVASSAVRRVVAEMESPGSSPYGTPVRRWEADPYDDPADRYGILRRLLETGQQEPARAAVEESGLRGMGGAGFPTGIKWKLVAGEAAGPKYVVCNADESEPGTFKDRVVLHDLPHLVLEGMAIAAAVVGAERGWVFIRHEYGPERERIEAAIREAREAGALGDDIFGTGFRFDVEVFVSPGGYILGEETALLECMEDRRGEPRNKPPFPGQKGLWGRPTLINNVETFAHAVGIVGRGVDWWRSLGAEGFAGHKFLSVSGDVARPDVLLVPTGTPLREVLARCGGMKDGRPLAAIAPGGASSNFLGPDALDTPLDFDALAKAGSMLGSGAAVFVAEGHDLLEVGVNVASFFRNESCGKCVPCRVGSEKAVAMLEGRASLPKGAEPLLEELNETLAQTSICGLGQVALGPLLSILRRFPDRIEREG